MQSMQNSKRACGASGGANARRSLQQACARAAAGRSRRPSDATVVRAAPSTTDLRARVDEVVHGVLKNVPPTKRTSVEAVGVEKWQALKDAGVELALDKVFADRIPGGFIMEVTTDQRAFEGDVTNMARFTFAQFKPLDLKVELSESARDEGRKVTGLPDLYRGPYQGLDKGYVLFTHFRIVEDEAQAEGDRLLGVQAAVAEWGLPAPPEGEGHEQAGDKLTVSFRKMRIEPSPTVAKDPAKLARWLALLLPHNPTMDPKTGVAEVQLPANGPVGVVKYLLMDQDLQAHVGNTGSHMILRRWAPPAGTPGAALLKA